MPGVLLDRVNVGGNETGQQSNFAPKARGPQDVVWTMDGIVITDMAATGARRPTSTSTTSRRSRSSTAGQDIKQPTGGVGHQPRVKRGTNQFHGGAAASSRRLARVATTCLTSCAPPAHCSATSDHNKQIGDYGFDVGGPMMRDKAWFYGVVLAAGRAAACGAPAPSSTNAVRRTRT